MSEVITKEEAETFFRFFYIATSGAKYYEDLNEAYWPPIDRQFREMRHAFFDEKLQYREEDRGELVLNMEGTIDPARITTAAYGYWVREKHGLNPDL